MCLKQKIKIGCRGKVGAKIKSRENMKKLLFIILFFVCCVSPSFANSYGRIGASVSSDILPNFVNLIFGGSDISKATEAEMKQAEEELALSLQHARSFIANRYSKDSPYKSSIERTQKELLKAENDVKLASRWKTMSDDEKYEYAKEQVKNRVNKGALGIDLFDEKKYGGNIYIEIEKLNADFSERTTEVNKSTIKRLNEKIKELGNSTNKSLDRIMRLIELSPETVNYFYSKYCSILTRQYSLRKPALSSELDDYMNELETCGIIRDQSHAVALKKKRVTQLALNLARQRDYAKWTKSQNVINLFNSIFLNGYAYYNDYSGTKGSSTKYIQIDVNRHLGSIVDVLLDPSSNDSATLVNTTAILEAQTVKKVLAELFEMYSISGEMRTLEFIASPSMNAIYDAKRKLMESENELKNQHGIVQIYIQYKPRALYLELLTVSLECDKIIKQALINNIKNEELANDLYNSKIKEILGNTVKASGGYYYNF